MAVGVRNPGALPNVLARVEKTRNLLVNPELDAEVRAVVSALLAMATTQHELNKRLWEAKKGSPEPHSATHIYGDDAIGGALGGHGLSLIPVRDTKVSLTMNRDDWLIRADATSAAVVITLPPASDRPGRLVAVAKVDDSVNVVTISPSGADTLAGEAESFDLLVESEVLSLISNGTDWTVT